MDPKSDDDEDFKPREYQIEVLENAIKENSIIFLPTGSGKTFIASMLIRHFCGGTMKSYSEGGKRTFFLVNTVPLVSQQAESIAKQIPGTVGQYTGDLGVDYWDRDKWLDELENHNTLVMTAQIFLNMLLHNYIQFCNVNLIIFDECHHAVNNHVMRQIMQQMDNCPVKSRPHILGLTATLLNSTCTKSRIENEIHSLEVTLQSKIITALNEEMVSLYSTNPLEKVIAYNDAPYYECFAEVSNCVEYLSDIISSVMLTDEIEMDLNVPSEFTLMNDKTGQPNKNLTKILKQILDIGNSLGIYAVSKAVLSKIILLERLKLGTTNQDLLYLLNAITTHLHMLRKQIYEVISKEEPHNQPIRYASPKLLTLLTILKDIDPENLTIVFVTHRITAKVLYYIVKELQKNNPEFSEVKADFMVGFSNNPLKETRESLFERKVNMEALKKFNSKVTNVMFATDVIEEGIDISLCNYVIKFDEPTTFRSYIQSKGRARHQGSNYIVFTSGNFVSISSLYKHLEQCIKKKLCSGVERSKGTEIEAMEKLYNQELKPYKTKNAVVTALSAIPLINRYCNSLPQDKFTNLTIFWWLKHNIKEGTFVVSMQLPINSPIKELIEGPACQNSTMAKRGVALKACRLLHLKGELDDDLLPLGRSSELMTDKTIYPMWDYNDEVTQDQKPGTKKNRRVYLKHFPKWVCECRPRPMEQLFLHVLLVTPNYPYPNTNRTQVFYNLLKSDCTFALLTTKKWPQVCQFPMFMNVGEVIIDLKVNHTKLKLDKNEIDNLIDFHSMLFTDVQPLVKKFLMRDKENLENAYLIVPTMKSDSSDKYVIDWDTVNNNKTLPEIKEVPLKDRKNMTFTEEMYNQKIVVPWYRPRGNDMKYVVTKVCSYETPDSPFPSENYTSYAEYFQMRYGCHISNLDQPLIEVRAISSHINCLLPRGKRRNKRKYDDDFEETLVPELCILFTFPAVYMLKLTVLPSALHRINYLLLAEELRCSIACKPGLGIKKLPEGQTWEALTVDHGALQEQECLGVQSTIEISDMLNKKIQSISSEQWPWSPDQEPVDIERCLDVDIMSIVHYDKFVSTPLNEMLSPAQQSLNREVKLYSHLKLKSPKINILELTIEDNKIGPQQWEVLQVLTASTANDVINYERLETLGDSFLKFIVSLSLFVIYPDKDEGKLTNVKGKIIGNRNLYYCGNNIKLGNIIKTHDFAPSDWDVPGFTLMRSIQQIMRDVKISSGILYCIKLSDEERDTGTLNADNYEVLQSLLVNSSESVGMSHTNLSVLGQQPIPDKTIADAVEALIGLYLKCCGVQGGLTMVKWLGVLSVDMSQEDRLLYDKPPSALLPFASPSLVEQHLIAPDILEKKIGYCFKDRSFLLQAFSHSSCSHFVTDCYQRLEFLGDAILDFLITCYIYENCGNLSPGELTDLRSALVNNVTFACLSVRLGLHTHMVARVCELTNIINRFVSHQESRHHAIGAEVLFLVEEDEIQLAESVDVPKVLGDLFEALAAAIYLDSNKSLTTVWKVFYRFMAKELEEFSKDVPKNHIRLLYEQFPSPPPKFGPTQIVNDNKALVPLEVFHNGNVKVFHGYGVNKDQAKLAAAKHALRFFHTPKADINS